MQVLQSECKVISETKQALRYLLQLVKLGAARYLRSDRLCARAVAGHDVLVPVDGALPDDVLLLVLDGPVARRLWELLASPRSAEELAWEAVLPEDMARLVKLLAEDTAESGSGD